MGEITTIGHDLAKRVFQVHAVGADGKVVVRRQLRRNQVPGFFAGLAPCLIGMEACWGAHYWARELAQVRARGAADATVLRQALCQARQDRCD